MSHPHIRYGTTPSVPPPIQRSHGMSMIEVLIALIVLSIGLLGLAALQAVALSRSNSADQRSQAINLAVEMIDMVRANRREALRYATTFSAADCSQGDALPPTGISDGASTAIPERSGWIARARCVLPQAEGEVVIDNDEISVTLTWTDARWLEEEPDPDNPADPGAGLAGHQTSFTMTSRF